MQTSLFTDPEELKKIAAAEEEASKIQIEDSWKKVLKEEFSKSYFLELRNFLKQEYTNKKIIYPPPKQIFYAFDLCPFDRVKVVILGQDPYHGPKQAHGACFSVNKGISIPPSLQNIYKELQNDLGIKIPNYGNLEKWAKQGVLLLNATLTVQASQPMSHAGKGWENFTDAAIKAISEKKENVIFLLWGRHAQAKKILIDEKKHHILTAPHPSPFSAHNGFFGCKHFSRANEILKETEQVPIDWQIE